MAATAGFGLTYHIKDATVFLIVSISLRLVQGFGDAACSTAIFSIIAQEFPEKRDEFLGYVEAAVGVGLMSGPVIGQVIFTLTNYQWTFYISGILISFSLIAQIIYIPSSFNQRKEEYRDDTLKTMQSKKLTFGNFLTNRRAMVAAVSAIFAMVFMLFMGPIIAPYYTNDLGVNVNKVGYLMFIPNLVYSLSCTLVSYFTKCVSRVVLT